MVVEHKQHALHVVFLVPPPPYIIRFAQAISPHLLAQRSNREEVYIWTPSLLGEMIMQYGSTS